MAAQLLPSELRRKLDHMHVITHKQFMGRMRGEQRSIRKGQSMEFADYRSYAVGDDIRFIDWKIYARLDRLFRCLLRGGRRSQPAECQDREEPLHLRPSART